MGKKKEGGVKEHDTLTEGGASSQGFPQELAPVVSHVTQCHPNVLQVLPPCQPLAQGGHAHITQCIPIQTHAPQGRQAEEGIPHVECPRVRDLGAVQVELLQGRGEKSQDGGKTQVPQVIGPQGERGEVGDLVLDQ